MSYIVKFIGGPLSGHSLTLKRTPFFIRGVFGPGGQIDAFDQLYDSVGARETAFAYEVAERRPAKMFVCKRGGKGGYVSEIVDYKPCDPQPSQEIMLSNMDWAEWCQAKWAERKAKS